MRRNRTSSSAVTLVAALAAFALLVIPTAALGSARHGAHAAGARLQIGIADEQAAMFTNPAYISLHLGISRYIAPYDVIENPTADDLAGFTAWLAAAQAAGVQPLLAFGHSDAAPHSLPSTKRYTADVKAFRRAYPQIRLYQPWDEANDNGGGAFGEPTPRQAANYYLALKHACSGCTIVGLDILDTTTPSATVRYIDKFKTAVGARNIPKIWGLHNYSDTNRYSEKGTKAVLRATRGQVWLTETGGIADLAPSFPFNLQRQSKAVAYMFKLAKISSRITRLYIYQWTGAPAGSTRFDAGLTDAAGTPRPAYCVVYEHVLATSTCPVTTASD